MHPETRASRDHASRDQGIYRLTSFSERRTYGRFASEADVFYFSSFVTCGVDSQEEDRQYRGDAVALRG